MTAVIREYQAEFAAQGSREARGLGDLEWIREAGVEQDGRARPFGHRVVRVGGGVDNVIWCTGFRPDFSWIDLPVFGEQDELNEPIHHRGIVADQPGLYFVGLFFLYAMSSGFSPGVGRDAEHIVKDIASRTR